MKPLTNIGTRVVRKSNILLHFVMLLIGGAIILSSAYALPDNLIGEKSKQNGKTEKVKKKKKKPNVAVAKAGGSGSDSKAYVQAMSKKNVKNGTKQSSFSTSKARYKVLKGAKKVQKQTKKSSARQPAM